MEKALKIIQRRMVEESEKNLSGLRERRDGAAGVKSRFPRLRRVWSGRKIPHLDKAIQVEEKRGEFLRSEKFSRALERWEP